MIFAALAYFYVFFIVLGSGGIGFDGITFPLKSAVVTPFALCLTASIVAVVFLSFFI